MQQATGGGGRARSVSVLFTRDPRKTMDKSSVNRTQISRFHDAHGRGARDRFCDSIPFREENSGRWRTLTRWRGRYGSWGGGRRQERGGGERGRGRGRETREASTKFGASGKFDDRGLESAIRSQMRHGLFSAIRFRSKGKLQR